jgi:hypothetical protein
MTQLAACSDAAIGAIAPGPVTVGDVARPACEPGVLSVYARLIDAFGRAGVAWCYWKSSRRAAEVLAGKTDLDILVAPADQGAARRVLLACGFRLFAPVADRADASVECYLNLDEPSGLIAHVDLHTRLTLGGALLKTHRLPWEESLIRRAAPRGDTGLPLLDSASEAVLLVVRSCLELRRSDPVVACNWSATTQKFALDQAFLAGRVGRAAVRMRAAELLGDRIATSLSEAVFSTQPLHRQRALRRRVRRAMARFRTCGQLDGSVRGAWRACRAVAGAINRRALHWPRPWNRRVPEGGVVVAVMAVDGAGKSTLVRAIRGWLGPEIDVLPLYFGTGDGRPSWFLLPLKLMVPLASMLVRRKPKGSSHGAVTDAAPGLVYSVLLGIWASVLAVEKRVKIRAAHRAAARGMVVITDRFPQNEDPEFNDGPLLPRLRHVPAWLRAFEASAYALAAQLRPHLVIKLVASPELIASREPTMDPAVIRARVAAVGQLKLGGAPIKSIPASLPAVDVLRVAKGEIWRAVWAQAVSKSHDH